jgi:hypothetical protein
MVFNYRFMHDIVQSMVVYNNAVHLFSWCVPAISQSRAFTVEHFIAVSSSKLFPRIVTGNGFLVFRRASSTVYILDPFLLALRIRLDKIIES